MAPVVALKPREQFSAGEAGWRQPVLPVHPSGQVYTFPARAEPVALAAPGVAPAPRRWPPLVNLAVIVGGSIVLWGLIGATLAALV